MCQRKKKKKRKKFPREIRNGENYFICCANFMWVGVCVYECVYNQLIPYNFLTCASNMCIISWIINLMVKCKELFFLLLSLKKSHWNKNLFLWKWKIKRVRNGEENVTHVFGLRKWVWEREWERDRERERGVKIISIIVISNMSYFFF